MNTTPETSTRKIGARRPRRARISHTPSAAKPDSGLSASLRLLALLNVVSTTPRRARVARLAARAALRLLATNACEKCGLGFIQYADLRGANGRLQDSVTCHSILNPFVVLERPLFKPALTFGDEILESGAGTRNEIGRIGDHLAQPLGDCMGAGLRSNGHENLRVKCRVARLTFQSDLLGQFFARPQAGVRNRDLVFILVGETNEIARQISDLDRFAHVQHEDLSV